MMRGLLENRLMEELRTLLRSRGVLPHPSAYDWSQSGYSAFLAVEPLAPEGATDMNLVVTRGLE